MSAFRLVVDEDVCVGIGQCELLEPDVVSIGDQGFADVVDGATLPEDRARTVVDRCPSGALSMEPVTP